MGAVDSTDELSVIETKLENNWNSDNTYDRTPEIRPIWRVPGRVNYAQKDYVFLYMGDKYRKPLGIGYQAEEIRTIVFIDIRCTKSIEASFRDLAISYRNEIIRILQSNDGSSASQSSPSPWQWWRILTEKDLTNKKLNFSHYLIELELVHFSQATIKS